ncbi:MAG: hypothetical protein WC627_06155, partial [Legionella sp.]
GKTTLDLLPFVPLEGFAVGAVRYGVAEVGARVGVFGGKGAVVEEIGEMVPHSTSKIDYGVAFFGKDNVLKYYLPGFGGWVPTLGAKNRPFFHMKIEDAALIDSPVKTAIETGFAPSVKNAWERGGDIYGLAFPTKSFNIRTPVKADAMGWPHFFEGGHTAINAEGTSYFLVNKTREFVLPGGDLMPKGSVLFRLEDSGAWKPLIRY